MVLVSPCQNVSYRCKGTWWIHPLVWYSLHLFLWGLLGFHKISILLKNMWRNCWCTLYALNIHIFWLTNGPSLQCLFIEILTCTTFCNGVYFKCRNCHGRTTHASWETAGEGVNFVWATDLFGVYMVFIYSILMTRRYGGMVLFLSGLLQ